LEKVTDNQNHASPKGDIRLPTNHPWSRVSAFSAQISPLSGHGHGVEII
jgi:hypothetical protein